ncbi:MAG: hypothetical protein LBF88_10660 [Planctomycetaceae bacterium]|nr:hypothetical protein [Planctomycetaceae bacterium]
MQYIFLKNGKQIGNILELERYLCYCDWKVFIISFQ